MQVCLCHHHAWYDIIHHRYKFVYIYILQRGHTKKSRPHVALKHRVLLHEFRIQYHGFHQGRKNVQNIYIYIYRLEVDRAVHSFVLIIHIHVYVYDRNVQANISIYIYVSMTASDLISHRWMFMKMDSYRCIDMLVHTVSSESKRKRQLISWSNASILFLPKVKIVTSCQQQLELVCRLSNIPCHVKW